jgi:hypothetical protein
MRNLIVVLSTTLLASTALAETSPAPATSTTQCTKAGKKTTLKRTIDLKSTESGGCRLFLTRDDGEPAVVAHADHKVQVCSDIREKVIANLKESGFTCE